MDDQNSAIQIIDENVEFAFPEGGMSPLPIIQENQLTGTINASQEVVPPETQTGIEIQPPPSNPSPQKEHGVDQEPLFHATEQSITNFFDRANIGVEHIRQQNESIRYGTHGLVEASDTARGTSYRLRDVGGTDYRVDEIAGNISMVQQRIEDQIEQTHRQLSPNSHGSQLADYIQQQKQEWLHNGGLEDFMAELKAASAEPDSAIKVQRLDALRERVIEFVSKVAQEGDNASANNAIFVEDTKNRMAGVPARLEDARYVVSNLREQLGDSYWQTTTAIDRISENLGYFRGNSAAALDQLPLEYRLISNAAHELGVTVSQLFELLKNPAVNQ